MKIINKLRGSVAFKCIFGIVLLLAVFSAIVSAIGYRSFTDAMLTQYAEGGFRTANIAATVLDGDKIDDYFASKGTSSEYETTWKMLDRLCNVSGATFIYLIVPDRSDYGHITFLFSTINHNSSYKVYDFGYVRETTNDDYRRKYKALYEEGSGEELVIRDKGQIETDSHITAMVPLKGSDGETKAIICVQRQMEVLTRERNAYINKVLIAMLLIALVTIIGQGTFFHRMMISPIQKITKEAARFAKENVTPEKKLKETIRSRDEIGVLADSVDRMEEQIYNYVQDLTRITAERERIHTELMLATRIQEDMLPTRFPAFPDRPEIDIYATMQPAKEVGGDLYDFFLMDEDHLFLAMADVSGKGIPAALLMMALKFILENTAMQTKSPGEILEIANSLILRNNREEMFITVWLGILEISSGKLKAANAGHEYPVIKQPDGIYELRKDPHSFVIGGMEDVRYKEYELTLQPGSRLFVYTDGVPEAANAVNELFGTDRMIDALNQDRDASPEMLLKNVRNAVDSFADRAEQFDDMTMMCLEYKGAGAMSEQLKNVQNTDAAVTELELEATIGNLGKMQAFAEQYLEEQDCPMKAQMQIGIAMEEVYVNVANYAYAPGTGSVKICLGMHRDPDAVTITFIDRGVPYDPLAKEDPDISLSAEERQIGGLGIYLVKKNMDRVEYEYRDQQNILKLTKFL